MADWQCTNVPYSAIWRGGDESWEDIHDFHERRDYEGLVLYCEDDSSMVSVGYDSERVVHFAAQAGAAEAFAKPLAVEFGLIASAESRPNS